AGKSFSRTCYPKFRAPARRVRSFTRQARCCAGTTQTRSESGSCAARATKIMAHDELRRTTQELVRDRTSHVGPPKNSNRERWFGPWVGAPLAPAQWTQ